MIAAIILTLSAAPVHHMQIATDRASVGNCAVVAIWDGDSFRCDGERIRIASIDAPELPGSPRCEHFFAPNAKNPPWCDHALAIRARDALRALLASGPVRIERRGVDRYGRTLARVTANGIDAGLWLISRNLAREWRW